LATSDFPFIRYQTGDMGALSARLCGCGRGLPVLEEIQGRTTDFVVAADGTVMHGLALIYPIRDLPGVAAFKVIQHSLNHTEVQIVANGDYSLAVANDIQSGIQARLGKNVTVDVQKVEAIQPERSGKFRYIVSHVPLP
jgi:phenylacetate-CoA ligase